MRNYPVLITEMLQVTVSVKADCAAEAVAKVKEHWGRGDILLDADQFTGVEISAVDGESTIMLHRDCDGNEYLESLQIKSQAPNGTCCKEIWQKVGRKKCSTNKPPQSAGLKREKRK